MAKNQMNYVATLDDKKRITIRGAKYKYYLVRVAPNGVVLLQPQNLVPACEISKKTLEMMDQGMDSLKKGEISQPIDLSEFKEEK